MTDKNELNRRIMLEALITERVGMDWENWHCTSIGMSPSYGEVEFLSIADAMRKLVEKTK